MDAVIIIPEGFTGFIEFPDGRREEWLNGRILERPFKPSRIDADDCQYVHAGQHATRD